MNKSTAGHNRMVKKVLRLLFEPSSYSQARSTCRPSTARIDRIITPIRYVVIIISKF